jgi:hypothetical protein
MNCSEEHYTTSENRDTKHVAKDKDGTDSNVKRNTCFTTCENI